MKPLHPKIGLALTIACLAALPLAAQATRDIAGTWQGTLPIGKGERIVLKITKQGAALSGTVFGSSRRARLVVSSARIGSALVSQARKQLSNAISSSAR